VRDLGFCVNADDDSNEAFQRALARIGHLSLDATGITRHL